MIVVTVNRYKNGWRLVQGRAVWGFQNQLLKLKGLIPKNTQRNDRWASTTFMEWMEQRDKHLLERDHCPKSILGTEDAHCLVKWFSLFTIEGKKDVTKYPPASIHLLLCGLQRIKHCKNRQPFDIFDKRDARFRDFHGTMESVFQSLHELSELKSNTSLS